MTDRSPTPTVRKFAIIPTVVDTWRKNRSHARALVWMQWYFVSGIDKFSPLPGDDEPGKRYCTYLGFFSIEI